MKLTVLQENLSKALSNCSRFTTQRAQLPVLGNIKLTTKKTKLILDSTNLEVSLSISVGAQIETEGELTVPAKTITEIVSNLGAGQILLEADKEQLKVSTQNFSSTLSGMNASDFPLIPQKIDETQSLSLPRDEFLSSLAQVSFAVSQDETRPILTGVLFLFKKDSLVLVATDGFRLSQKKIKLEKAFDVDSLVLPRTILSEVSKLGSESENLFLNFKKTENQVVFGLTDTVISSRVLNGEFPDYEKIIPKTGGTKVQVDKEDLLRAVRLASVFAKESANIINFGITKDFLKVNAESQTSGSQKNKIDARVDGEGVEISFNYRFVEDFLHSVKGEDVQMEFSSPNAPGIFTDPSEESYLHLIMPVKIQS
jgi:DNA polymerase-3 subunit beta